MKSRFTFLLTVFLVFSGFFSQYAVPWFHSCPKINPLEALAQQKRISEHCHNVKVTKKSDETDHSHSICPVCQGYLQYSALSLQTTPILYWIQNVIEVFFPEPVKVTSFFIQLQFAARAPPFSVVF